MKIIIILLILCLLAISVTTRNPKKVRKSKKVKKVAFGEIYREGNLAIFYYAKEDKLIKVNGSI